MNGQGETAADAALRPSEIHRYFPEWAERPTGPDAQQESDRNSYLACGYADEFGYGTSAGRQPAIAPLAGVPEGCRLWREQIGALHPGYPECPQPVERDERESSREASAMHPLRGVPPHARAAFRVIQCNGRDRGRPGRAALRLGLLAFIAERLIRSRRLNDVL
ncbi:MAG TPA: hypothetical protein VND24_00535 [Steroidobacteraceae bacterium]|nr:hypothetical protein [Steroidobacteraceae bacterium]